MYENIAFSSGSFFNTSNFLMEYDYAISFNKNNKTSQLQLIANDYKTFIIDKSFKHEYSLKNYKSIHVMNKKIPRSFIIASNTVRVDSNINPINVSTACCIDSNSKKYNTEEIKKTSTNVFAFNNRTLTSENFAFSRTNHDYEFKNCLKTEPTSINVTNNTEDIIVKNNNLPYIVNYSNTVIVENIKKENCNKDALSIKPVTISVSDYKPPASANTANGQGVKFIRLIGQKNSYSEIFLDFNLRKIVEIIGLPNGLILERNSIKGTPLISGKYPLSIKLDNNTTINALLIIPELPRQL